MDQVQKTIIKLLIASDDFKYLYDKNDVSYNNQNKINYFYNACKQELAKTNCCLKEEEIKKIWFKIREKFVKINLAKSRGKSISDNLNSFYNYCIFLEDFISHNNGSTYSTKNKKEILQQVYDDLMGNTYLDTGVELNINELLNTNNSDNHDLEDSFNLDALEYDIQILEGYEEAVFENLRNEQQKTYQKKRNDVNREKKDNPVENSLNQRTKVMNIKKPVTQETYSLKSLPSVMSTLQVTKTEKNFGSCRSKQQQLLNTKQEALIFEIVKVFNEAVLEGKTTKSKVQRLQLILKSIKKFCANLEI